MGLNAGALRHRLTLEAPSETADGGGGVSVVWNAVTTVWAAVEPLGGSERLRAQRLETPVSHRVTMRYRAGVTPAMRLRFGARILNIRSVVNPDERGISLELLCEEGVAT